jgi:hypothetical protein
VRSGIESAILVRMHAETAIYFNRDALLLLSANEILEAFGLETVEPTRPMLNAGDLYEAFK